MGYLLARFPVGVFTFTVATAFYAGALFLIAAPVVAPFDTIELGIWRPDAWYEGLALVPLGLCCSSRPGGSPRVWPRCRAPRPLGHAED